jgi:hypothetical protein
VDNLCKRHIIAVDWCCMYKNCGETPDHLLLHWDIVRDLWNSVFRMFGVEWVMPTWVVELLNGFLLTSVLTPLNFADFYALFPCY